MKKDLSLAFSTGAVLAASVFFILMSGCSRAPQSSEKDIVAYVNKDPIYRSDVMRDIAIKAKLDPSFKNTPEAEREALDALIDRKIIVQSAMAKGLAREERFVSAIRNIWEHALIRDFVDYKNKEFRDFIFVTDDDIKNFYDKLSKRVTFRIYKTLDRSAADAEYDRYSQTKDTSAWQVIGPTGFEDIGPSVLADSFTAPKGEVRRASDGLNYYLIEVAEVEEVSLPPLNDIKNDLARSVAAMKERRLFENWLAEQRSRARVNIK